MIFNPSKATLNYMKILNIKEYPFTNDNLTSAFREKAKEHHADTGDNDTDMMRKVIEAKDALKILTSEEVNTPKTEGDAPNGATKKCNSCHGSCVKIYYGFPRRESCTNCDDGKVTLKCKCCNSGRFKLRSGRKVPCNACKGTGVWRIVNCHTCKGSGHKTVRIKETSMCQKCKGHGIIKSQPFNPVLPEGALLLDKKAAAV